MTWFLHILKTYYKKLMEEEESEETLHADSIKDVTFNSFHAYCLGEKHIVFCIPNPHGPK